MGAWVLINAGWYEVDNSPFTAMDHLGKCPTRRLFEQVDQVVSGAVVIGAGNRLKLACAADWAIMLAGWDRVHDAATLEQLFVEHAGIAVGVAHPHDGPCQFSNSRSFSVPIVFGFGFAPERTTTRLSPVPPGGGAPPWSLR